jgi:hypothetical protein
MVREELSVWMSVYWCVYIVHEELCVLLSLCGRLCTGVSIWYMKSSVYCCHCVDVYVLVCLYERICFFI